MGQQHSDEQGAHNVSTGPSLEKTSGTEAHSPAEQLSRELASRFARKVQKAHLVWWTAIN